MFGALAMMLPDKVTAAGDGGNTGISIGGYYATRASRSSMSTSRAARGAEARGPMGLDGNSHMMANMASQSIEVTEAENADGGDGLRVRDRQARAPENIAAAWHSGATIGSSSTKGCCRSAPTGAIIGRSGFYGGSPGQPSENYLNPDGENRCCLPS